MGEKVHVQVHLRNEGWLPLTWVRLHDSLPVQLKSPNFFRAVLSLLPHEERTLGYNLECRKRGYYPLGPLLVSAGDPFGLRQYERQMDVQEAIMVYPHIVPLARLSLPAQTPFGSIATKQRIFEDPTRMVGVRDYQSGDSLRQVHWKSTAMTGRLQVKRFEPAISIESQIFLNLNRDEYTRARAEVASELAIVTAASIANHLIERRQTVGLSCNGHDPLREPEATPGPDAPAAPAPAILLPPRKGAEQLMHILDALARVQTSAEIPFTDLLRQARLHLTWGGTGIIISAHADEALFEHMLLMKRSGFHVMLILVDPREPFAGLKERAHEVGIHAHAVWQENDLDVWR
jgi:uncharacterized protein (DUF58 family)